MIVINTIVIIIIIVIIISCIWAKERRLEADDCIPRYLSYLYATGCSDAKV